MSNHLTRAPVSIRGCLCSSKHESQRIEEEIPTRDADAIKVILKAMTLRKKYFDADIDAKSTIVDHIPQSVKDDLQDLWSYVSKDSKTRSFCDERMKLHELAFDSYQIKNQLKELEADKKDFTDFYRVPKIDCHLHYESIATTKQFYDWLKGKYDTEGDIVADSETGKTIKQLLEEEGFHSDVSADDLGTQATFLMKNNFAEFNNSFNPLGSQKLHDLIWGFENAVDGRWAAEYLKDFAKIAATHNVYMEPRISIYGRDPNEWDAMSKWAKKYGVCKIPNVRVAVQMPRIFPVWKGAKMIENFGEMLTNFFDPIYRATLNPEEHLELAELLKHVKMFDTVDDESKLDNFDLSTVPVPGDWNSGNPSYAYYAYYFYANITAINMLRKQRDLNTFQFRPHCGESGPVDHLATGFLFCQGISHGINLCKSPVLQYLFYVCQIGIGVSPLSNRALFLKYLENPFPSFFKRGLRCTLTTDDPLQFHMTDVPLMEEYATARSVWDLSATDLSEIARNGVLTACEKKEANALLHNDDPNVTNIPKIRLDFRAQEFADELDLLGLAPSQK